ncbi:MAG: formylmethanofuran dehydrogenase subunit E family protein [bacterium]
MCYLNKKMWLLLVVLILLGVYFNTTPYFPLWAKFSQNNMPIKVLDTNSSLGRYSTYTKKIGLKDLALIHGHLCDGLVIAFVELKEVLKKLFPNGVIDRTDLRVVSKNGPCWVDAAAMMTGARINFGTLSIDKNVGNGFIVQKISTGETYQVKLKDGVFPVELAELEAKIKSEARAGKKVSDDDIQKLEAMANELSKKVLNTELDKLMEIKKIEDYKFKQNIEVGVRTDIMNKKQ